MNVSPPNATYWTIPDAGQINYRYIVAGYADPNVAFLQSSTYRQWNQFALYEQGQIVSYNNAFYEAVYQNIGAVPTTAAWIPTGIEPPIEGLYECSTQCDLLESSFTTGFLQPFPRDVAGQLFNPSPKRLLNSILGFTWNGIMNPSKLANIPIVSILPTSDIDLFNRIRPIPLYVPSVPAPPLGAAQSSITQIYTADGYANLVYSSILSIYATIVAGSTINTNQNTGLLALTSMNTGNLGVSFYSQPIVQPLSVNGTDIYTIGLYFEDEFGEPYFFTNNAVLSFMLKITYKNKVVLK